MLVRSRERGGGGKMCRFGGQGIKGPLQVGADGCVLCFSQGGLFQGVLSAVEQAAIVIQLETFVPGE